MARKRESVASPVEGRGIGRLPSDPSLEPAAERVAEAWYSVRKSRLGIPRPSPDKSLRRDKRWKDYMRIAKLCDESGWDPDDFVRAGVDYLGANGAFMVPSDLLADGIRSRYSKEVASMETEAAEPAEEWEFAEQLLESMAHGDAHAELKALASPFTMFPAWYRVVRSGECPSEWHALARSELRESPSLHDWLRSRFPSAIEDLFRRETEQ